MGNNITNLLLSLSMFVGFGAMTANGSGIAEGGVFNALPLGKCTKVL